MLGEDDAGGGEANAPPVTLEQGAIQRPLKGRNLSADNRDIEIQIFQAASDIDRQAATSAAI